MVKKLNRYNGKTSSAYDAMSRARNRAVTRMEVLVVVASAVILFLVFSFLAAVSGAKSYAWQMACESNLKQIGIAFRTWEGDHNDLFPMRYFTNQDSTKKFDKSAYPSRYFQIISNQLINPLLLICPADKRIPAARFVDLSNNNLSYFVGLVADESNPALWLAGDRNLVTNGVDVVPGQAVIRTNDVVDWSRKMHRNMGNLLMSDGSVVVQRNITNTSTNVTRLAVP
jgi:hypothetical protein